MYDWNNGGIYTNLHATNKYVTFGTKLSGGAYQAINGTSNVLDGNAHFCVGTLSGGTGRIYVDGDEETSGALQTPTYGIQDGPWIGRRSAHEYYTNGVIDEVAIFDYALSPTQIANLYTAATVGIAVPSIDLSTSAMSFLATKDGPDPNDQTFSITNDGEAGSELNWTAGDDMAWLTMIPDSGGPLAKDASEIVTVSVESGALAAGIYTGTITISDPTASNSPQTIAVTLTIIPIRRPKQAITLRRRKTGTGRFSIGDSVS